MQNVTKAFTMVEVIMAISLFSLMAFFPSMLDTGIVYRLQAEVAQDQVGQSIRKAQLNSKMGVGDSSWGINVQGNTLTVFKGDSYASRDTEFDDVYQYDVKTSVFTTSGGNEVIFQKDTGIPAHPISIRVVANDTEKVGNIILSASGGITYD